MLFPRTPCLQKPSRTSDKQLPPAEPIAPASAPTAIASESKILRIFRHSPQDLAEHITATDFELFAQIKVRVCVCV